MKDKFLLCVTHNYWIWLTSCIFILPMILLFGATSIIVKCCQVAIETLYESFQDLLNDLSSISLSYSNFLKIHDKTRKDKGSKK
jgi:hypothetical protein